MFNSVSELALKIGEAAGASQRQLDYWARCGVFGPELLGRGSGTRRAWWTPNITEAVYACAQLAELGAPVSVMESAARVVMPRPVNDHEWLIVTADGAMRIDHFCLDDKAPRIAGYVIPLRSFAASVPPTADGDDTPDGRSGVPGVAVATPPAAAAPNPSQ